MNKECIMKLTSDKKLWIENYKGLLKYENSEIVLRTKEGIVSIAGKRLSIEYFSEEDMLLAGKITCITVKNAGGGEAG